MEKLIVSTCKFMSWLKNQHCILAICRMIARMSLVSFGQDLMIKSMSVLELSKTAPDFAPLEIV